VATLRRALTEELSTQEVAALILLFDAAWRNKSSVFTAEDQEHAFGGMHFLMEEDGQILSHASVHPRDIHVGETPVKTGYVEAVATLPKHQGKGHASTVMQEVGVFLGENYQLGGLSTGIPGFYERFGWQVWEGPTFCRTHRGLERTEDDDGSVLVKLTPASLKLDLTDLISCETRSGDAW
jgi:aminoglycoside 2'-N-acetyltransferase I